MLNDIRYGLRTLRQTQKCGVSRMKTKILIAGLLTVGVLGVLCPTARAQSNWVGDFLNRYRPPAIDPAAKVTPQVSDAPWRLMVQQGTLPLSVGDVIRLMLESNLD